MELKLIRKISEGFNVIFIWLVLFYQRVISPMFPPSCRYYPTCSSYALTLLKFSPFWYALPISIWRIFRCNPFFKGGYEYPCALIRLRCIGFFPISVAYWMIPQNNSYTFTLFCQKVEFRAHIIAVKEKR